MNLCFLTYYARTGRYRECMLENHLICLPLCKSLHSMELLSVLNMIKTVCLEKANWTFILAVSYLYRTPHYLY
ncbi:hypothetical protein QVD17_21320 [Tagetes erecta]|uniref:Uncharacterized protein n=1 Tax=Tagetes erecta TaxID=13708 RepID=A0AAD8NSW5_TARER|nr:hypothetical protein QVD17_21320 [Tagetes erecta]